MGTLSYKLWDVIDMSDNATVTFKNFIKNNPEHTQVIRSLRESDISQTFSETLEDWEDLKPIMTVNLLDYCKEYSLKTLEKYVFIYAEPLTMLEILREISAKKNLDMYGTMRILEQEYYGNVYYAIYILLSKYFKLWLISENTDGLENFIPQVVQIIFFIKENNEEFAEKVLINYTDTLKRITYPQRRRILQNIGITSNWDHIRRFVKKTPIKQFVWESVCQKFGISEDNMEMLRKLAVEFDVVPAHIVGRLNKAQLCSAVNSIPNKIIDRESQSCPSEEMDEYTKKMIPVVDPFTLEPIPPYRRIKVGPTCFDVQSLHDLISRNPEAVHPLTRQSLPTERINALHAQIQQLGYPRNAYHVIKDTPIMTAEVLLKMRVTNLWNQLINPQPIDMFIGASNEKLDMMVRLLGEYGLFTEAEVVTYPENETTLQKQTYIVQTLEEKRLNVNSVSASTLVTVLDIVFGAPVSGGARRMPSRRRASKSRRRRNFKSRRRQSKFSRRRASKTWRR